MKITNLKFLLLLIIFMVGFVSTTPGTSNNPLTYDEQFVYLVNTFNFEGSNASTSISYSTFNVAGSQNLTAGTSAANFTIQYLYSVTNKSVTYKFIKGNNGHNATIADVPLVTGSGTFLSVDPTSFDINYPFFTNIKDFVNDISTFSLPFILPVSGVNDQLWTTLSTQAFPATHVSSKQSEVTFSTDISPKITSNQFQLSKSSKANGFINGYSIDQSLTLSCTYDLATGVLLGYKTSVSINDQTQLGTYQVTLNFEVVRSDYHFASKSSPGFEVFPALFSLFLITVISTRIKKYKFKK